MPRIDVKLPRSQSITFPDRCIVCDAPQPKDELRVRRAATSSWLLLFVPFVHLLSLLDSHTVHVPTCPSCARTLHFQAWWRWLALMIAIGVYAWFALDIAELWLPPLLDEIAVLAGALILIVPYWLWQELRPLAFDMTVSADDVTYMFRDATIARDFLSMNSIPRID